MTQTFTQFIEVCRINWRLQMPPNQAFFTPKHFLSVS